MATDGGILYFLKSIILRNVKLYQFNVQNHEQNKFYYDRKKNSFKILINHFNVKFGRKKIRFNFPIRKFY